MLRITGLCEGSPPITGGFPSQEPLTRKMFPFDDVIIRNANIWNMTIYNNTLRRTPFNKIFTKFDWANHLTILFNDSISTKANTTLIARFMGPTWGPSGPTGPWWAPCWPHELCYLGIQLCTLHHSSASTTSGQQYQSTISVTLVVKFGNMFLTIRTGYRLC